MGQPITIRRLGPEPVSTKDQFIAEREEVPTHSSKVNPSIVVSMNAAGDVVKVEKTIKGVVYTKTISQSDNVVASTQTISAWS
jgi:hypothetical protein